MEGNLGEYQFYRKMYEKKSNQAVATIYQGYYISILLEATWRPGGGRGCAK